MNLVHELEVLARLLEADDAKKKKRRRAILAGMVVVAAFRKVNGAGGLKAPTAISPGDQLYIQRTEQPGAGTITRDPAGRPFATAVEAVPAGKTKEIKVTLWEKRWVTDGEPCDECDDNAAVGWIPADEEFPSGHDEPLGHPNCKCSLEVREAA